MKPLLIEIGSEEIPARFISQGLKLIKDSLSEFFDKSSIEHGNIAEYATPRRLALYIEDVSEKQKDRSVEALGPPRKVAFDDKGSPSKAAIGFARSLNIDVKDLTVKKTERGEYMAATVEEKGRATRDVLSEVLPEIMSSLNLPKSMKWGSGSLRYFRPIQWILAMFGKDIIRFTLEDLTSSNITYGHRFLSPDAIEVGDPSLYLQLLSQNRVLADPAEREKAITDGIRGIEPSINCRVREDRELLDTVTNLVEYPAVVIGEFDRKYLSLPGELLITVMKSHQKYFSTEDADGNMQPFFIVISNTSPGNNSTVKKGAERVLRARLEDARFYFSEDQKKPFGEFIEELKHVTFQEKLGSVYDKAERVTSLCSFIADTLDLKSGESLRRASMLCKADLVTGVVGEFPELQGYMGMVYARNSGEDEEVASAVYEHYLPKFPGDSLPSGETGTVLSLADKMDSIASFFSIGLIPSGSEDPYALRRQAIAIINILQGRDYPLPLNILIEKSLESLVPEQKERKELCGKILEFFGQRLEGIFLSQGYGLDVVRAVLSTQEYNIQDLKHRAGILSEFKKDPGFPPLLMAAKRVYNILSRADAGKVNKGLFSEASEKELFTAAVQARAGMAKTGYRELFELEQPINTFFDKVLVMDKDPRVKENRLALLAYVKNTFDSLGDFSKIVE